MEKDQLNSINKNKIIIKKRLAVQGRERVINTRSVRRPPSPTIPTHRMKEIKRENSRKQKQKTAGAAMQIKRHSPALETRQSHTIEYGVTKIVQQRYWKENKSPAVLRCSAVRRRISVPMSDHSAACNQDRHIQHWYSTIKSASGYTWSCTAYIILPQIDDVQGHTQTHPQLKNWHQWQHGPVV